MFKIDYFEYLFLLEVKTGMNYKNCETNRKSFENYGNNANFNELKLLASVCIPDVPIARAMFFENLSSVYYSQMDRNQQKEMFEFISSYKNFNIENEYCLQFHDRFNPENQYKIETNFENKIEFYDAYLHNCQYYISKNICIDKKYIKTITKI
ncbi:MAG: hypothetical protein GY849_02295 [Deltaproteobacteria bacterium]|nr:hypothetical protein [Deltaproteobacteria bacterium]